MWPDAVFGSARTGRGIDEVRAAIEARLPRPAVVLTVLVPYDRGDLVARIHQRGEVVATDHGDDGTLLRVRVDEVLAAELARYAITVSSVAGNVR
jgi:GTP-binding protein HflX